MPSQLNQMHGVKTLEGSTVVELLTAAEARIEGIRADSREPWARELSLALTALEDAQMRFTRGLAKRYGVFAPADLERSKGVVARGKIDYEAPAGTPVPVIAAGVRVRSALQPNDMVEGLHGRFGTVERIDPDRGEEGTVAQYCVLVGLEPTDGGPAHMTWFRPDELVVVE
jgi:hypothetical protein